ncbi:MAG: S-layer homology domain-containing protein [Candidatus Latescibacterota bacterium]|nr:MAG: S-layer homology domain-containing protein [Candidatus Latescibacterota bacterium]
MPAPEIARGLLTPNPKISFVQLVVLATVIFSGCASPKTTVEGRSSLERAIHYYIEGEWERAEALFAEVTQQQNSDEDVQTAYLYLGRIYMARGDNERAADAFSAGRMLGGNIRFDDYFALVTRGLDVSAATIAREPYVTRAQLAALIVSVLGPALGVERGDDPAPVAGVGRTEDIDKHWASEDIKSIKAAGVMRMLPDGRFHPDEKVTRSAFFIVLSRLVTALDLDTEVMREIYPGGFRDTLARRDAGLGKDPSNELVSGREVVEGLQTLSHAAEL